MSKRHRRLNALGAVVQPKAALVKQSVCSLAFIYTAIKTAGLVIFYYSFSISLTFYNQRYISASVARWCDNAMVGHLWEFKLPLSITITHLFVKFVLAWIVREIYMCRTGKERVTLSWSAYFKKLAPAGITSSLDIGLSNWSFEFITISLYTMSKSTCIIFILFFAIVFRLEKARCSLIFVVLFIALGLFMFTFQSTQFNLEGFLLVLSASFIGGLRWSLAQLIIQRAELGLRSPIDMMYHIQPWMIVTLLPLSAFFEGVTLATTDNFFRFSNLSVLSENCGIVLGGACLAFMLEFSEFLLLTHTSSLTLSISGIFKEICTLYLASAINGDEMNTINAIGLGLSLVGIMLHVVLKAIHSHAKGKDHGDEEESREMLIVNGNANARDESEEETDLFNVQRDRT